MNYKKNLIEFLLVYILAILLDVGLEIKAPALYFGLGMIGMFFFKRG